MLSYSLAKALPQKMRFFFLCIIAVFGSRIWKENVQVVCGVGRLQSTERPKHALLLSQRPRFDTSRHISRNTYVNQLCQLFVVFSATIPCIKSCTLILLNLIIVIANRRRRFCQRKPGGCCRHPCDFPRELRGCWHVK